MELICPSCKARYGVPAGLIRENGRQVSCTNCGHGWHAFPPLELGATAQPGPGGAAPQASPRPEPSGVATAADEPEEPPPPPAEPADAAPARRRQFAEIRDMLADVQSEERTAPPAAKGDVEPRTASEAPPAADKTESADEPEPARQHTGPPDRKDEAARTGIEQLRERHDREAREEAAIAPRTSALLTLLLVIVMIGAAMTALYLLAPQITARIPAAEPVMTGYVDAIDGLIAEIGDGFDAAQGWLTGPPDESA